MKMLDSHKWGVCCFAYQIESNGAAVAPFEQAGVLELKNESITAVAFGRRKLSDGRYLVAVGLESGVIKLYALGQWDLLLNISEE